MLLYRKIFVMFKNCLFIFLSFSVCVNIFEIGKVEVCDLYFFLIESEEIDVYIF